MKNIAVITPCILPVPAVDGGAVEELITHLIKANESSESLAIDLYSIASDSYSNFLYKNTNIIQIFPSNIKLHIDKYIDALNRRLLPSAVRLIDNDIIAAFSSRLDSLDKEYDAVIVENQMSTALKVIELRNKGYRFPVFFHMHNDIDVYRSPKACKQLASAGVQFISVSKYIKSQILKYAPNAVVHTLYNGIDFSEYTTSEHNEHDTARFLYAGRVIPEKGVLQLLEAFENAKTDASLDIIGFSDRPTRYEHQVLSKAKKSNKEINCLKRLQTAQMAEKYNDYDVVVMPTVSEEPFGLVALETIVKGLPLITTNSGGLKEVVGDMAFIVDKEDDFVANLANAIEYFSKKNNRLEWVGKNVENLARKKVEFDIHMYYDKFVSFLETADSRDVLVSIIVPVYNIEKYISRCIESILTQTYSNIELILVDDGATDGSAKLCQDYATKDSRIRVLHQPNQGLSAARNAGLDNARGEYVFFVDGDDYILSNTISDLLMVSSKTGADVVACGFSHVTDSYFKGSGGEARFTGTFPGIWSGSESVVQMMTTNNICTVAWNKLYKRSLFTDIRYPIGKLHEDEYTTYKLLYKSKIVAYVPEMYYKYYQRSEGIMSADICGRYRDYLDAIWERIDFFNCEGDMRLMAYSRIVLLDYIKYVYRNTSDKHLKKQLVEEYKYLLDYGTPKVEGTKKRFALWLWNYIKY